MSSRYDDEDLELSIAPSHGRRNSARSPVEQHADPMQRAAPQPRRSAEPTKLPTGNMRLGPYTFIKTLGEGSFGKVKLARHEGSNEQVAMKIISRRKLMARDMVGRVEREIQYLQLLRHPHIIKLYTVITTEKDIYMVLEYAGSELFNYLVDNGRMAEDKARTFFQQIVCAVEYCHRHKIVHRDLKPENLLLDENMHVKIADFGLSNIITDGNFLKTSCGSPNYAAPEVISGKLYAGPEVDVWSCGVILYVLLVGRLPFDDEYIPALFKKIQSGNYHIPQYISKGAANLIKKMLQVNPVQRITIQEIRQDPWFLKNLPDYLRPPVEEFMDTGVDPSKPIDPKSLAPSKPPEVVEELHSTVISKLRKTMGYGKDDVQQALAVDEPNAIKDAYLIVRENQIMRDTPSMSKDPSLKPFLAQSPTTHSQSPIAAMSERFDTMPSQQQSPTSSKPPSSKDKKDGAHRLSADAGQKMQARSPGGTIAVLPSSLPDYHRAFMSGHPQSDSQTGDDEPALDADPATRARRINPHSKSQLNLDRMSKPETSEKKKSKNTKWQFGIRSRNPPGEAMLAIYRALKTMGADWEVPKLRRPGEYREQEEHEHERSHSISGSEDSDDDSAKEGSSSTRRSSSSASMSTASTSSRGRQRRRKYGSWNDWGYDIPADPWIINARFRKSGMLPPGVYHPTSANSSRVDLTEAEDSGPRRRSSAMSTATEDYPSRRGSPSTSSLEQAGSTSHSTSSQSIGSPVTHRSQGQFHPQTPPVGSDDSAYVYLTIQLYSIGQKDQEMYVVDFKAAGYERLVRKLVRVLGDEEKMSLAELKDSATESKAQRARRMAENEDESAVAEADPSHPVPIPDEADHSSHAHDVSTSDDDDDDDPEASPHSSDEDEEDDEEEEEGDSSSDFSDPAGNRDSFVSGRPTESGGGHWDELRRRRSQKRSARSERHNRKHERKAEKKVARRVEGERSPTNKRGMKAAKKSDRRKEKASAKANRRGVGKGEEEGGSGSGSRTKSGTEARDFAAANPQTSFSDTNEQQQQLERVVSRTSNPGEEFEKGGHRYRETLVGDGRAVEEKDVSSPFPFLDVTSRLIIQLAEAS